MKKLFYLLLFVAVFTFGLSACGGEEIDACVGVADNANSHDDAVVACDDCCKSNGYKRGITTTTNSNTTCECSGEDD